MKRRIIKQGNNSYTVTLPVKWIRQFGLENNEIDIEENGAELCLKTSKGIILEAKEVDARNMGDILIKRTLAAIYKSGYAEVKVIYDKPETIALIQLFLKDVLLGYEIVSQKQDYAIIKNISSTAEDELDNLIRRSFLVTLDLGENLCKTLKDNQHEQLSALLNLEMTNNRLTTFCEKTLNTRGYKTSKKTTFVYICVWLLEKIADTYKEIILFILNYKIKKVRADITDVLDKCNLLLRSYYGLFYGFNQELMSKTLVWHQELKEHLTKTKSSSKEDIVLNAIIAKLADQTFDLSGPILGKEV